MQVSPTACFLQYLELPEHDTIDLELAAIVIMAHLDRLAIPYLPPATFLQVSAIEMVIRFLCI